MMPGGPRSLRRRAIVALVSASLVGCSTTVPYTGVGPYPQLERGAPILPVDVLGNVLALPFKLIFLSWRFDLHYISPATEDLLVQYLESRGDRPALKETKFRLNQYRPFQDLSRLAKNHYVAWPYRLLLGLPITLAFDVLLPGRLFPWGDYYNPFTNTVHLYSDHPAIALHEAGHAHDFAHRHYKGTYAAIRLIPFVDLYQEWEATDEAIGYLKQLPDHQMEMEAYKILYPAYGSYIGNYLFPPIGWLGCIVIGHLVGRSTAAFTGWHYEHPKPPTPAEEPAAAPAASEPTAPVTVPPEQEPSHPREQEGVPGHAY